VLNSKVIAI